MNSEHHHEDSRGASEGLTVILLGILILLALAAGAFFLLFARSELVIVNSAPVMSQSSDAAVPATSEAPEKNVPDSPFTDDDSKPLSAAPKPTTASNEQLVEAAQKAVAKKLNLTDNVAWGEAEFTKNEDGTVTVSGTLTADGMSRKWNCKLRSEAIGGKIELRTIDVTAE